MSLGTKLQNGPVAVTKITIGRLSAYQPHHLKDNVVFRIEARDFEDETSQEVTLTGAAARHFGAMIVDLFEEPGT